MRPEQHGAQVPRATLAGFGRALLTAAGATPGHAQIVVDHLLEADAMGLRSHGVMRVPQYLDDVAAGATLPAAVPTIDRFAPGRAAVDGNLGFGQVVGMAMAEEAVRLANAAGVGFVTGRRMGHSGRVGAYAEAIARHGVWERHEQFVRNRRTAGRASDVAHFPAQNLFEEDPGISESRLGKLRADNLGNLAGVDWRLPERQ